MSKTQVYNVTGSAVAGDVGSSPEQFSMNVAANSKQEAFGIVAAEMNRRGYRGIGCYGAAALGVSRMYNYGDTLRIN
jgi:hypothetical protein